MVDSVYVQNETADLAAPPPPGVDLFPATDPEPQVITDDRELIGTLQWRLNTARTGQEFRNAAIEALSLDCFSSIDDFHRLSEYLQQRGTFDINTEHRAWQDVDGETRDVLICRAATTGMFPMGTHYWVRDNALIGARFAFLPGSGERIDELHKTGKEILLSALTMMSSTKQLERFDNIINSRDPWYVQDASNWPYIFMGIEWNLNASQTEWWAQKQDALQILAFYTIEAIEKGVLSPDDLSGKHRAFLAKVTPFLAKTRFFLDPNSGSWEELTALRSSVLAWEVAVLEKIAAVSERPEFAFLSEEFDRHQSTICPALTCLPFRGAAEELARVGARQLAGMFPAESGAASMDDPAYRNADAAEMYMLQLDIPARAAALTGTDKSEWERTLLAQMDSLHAPETGGIRRYLGDSYQRPGYFRNENCNRLRGADFVTRGQILWHGPEAAWSHPAWQLSSWAGRKYRETGNPEYLERQKTFFREGLRMITAEGDVSLDQTAEGQSRVISIPGARIPECVIAEQAEGGEYFYFPSPHVPLNWAVAEAVDAFASMEMSLEADICPKQSS